MVKNLALLWTTGDKETSLNMILMYTLKSSSLKWWDECHLITWGASNELICKDDEIQKALKEVMEQGIKVFACKRCAERLGLVEELENLGITIDYMGEPLTKYLKDEEWQVLSI